MATGSAAPGDIAASGRGLTVWSFWQNAAQFQLYGSQANTLLDNASVIQIFGIRNYRMAQDLANVVGGISADELLKLQKSEHTAGGEQAATLQAGSALRRPRVS
ncbi:MAG TPA: TraM recognition domain-containing protein [Candidatus Sulfotelmatobacter sp.]